MLGIVLHVLSDTETGALHLQPLPVLGPRGSMLQMPLGGSRGGYGVTRRWCDPVDASAAGSCAERWRFSAEEFISARRSVTVENERKVRKKPVGLESRTYTKLIVLTCIPPWLVTCRRIFSQCLMIALPSTILQPKSAWCVLFGGVWKKPLGHACRSTENPGETVAVLAGQHGLGTGCFKRPR